MKGSKFRIREHFKSDAKIVYITQFHLGNFSYKKCAGTDLGFTFDFHPKSGWWPKMPVLIKSNGTPWEIGNAYLLAKLENKRPWDMEIIKARANYLLAYLRFLEDTGTDYLHFPIRRSERVTYVFKDTLQGFIAEGLNPTYASNIISTIVDFYRTIVGEGFIEDNDFDNQPYKDIHRSIKFMDTRGFSRLKKVTTTDLSIRHVQAQKRLDRISDGGALRPLRIEEQKAILAGFAESLCPYNLELMMRITLSTGARMQTVCTIREHHIKSAYKSIIENNSSSVEIQAGNGAKNDGHLINTKRGKLHRLLFPKKLIEDLYIYLSSEYHLSLRAKSFYGDSDTNYLFLTERGSPFYISNQEIKDRQADSSYSTVSSKGFIQNKGDTVRMNLKKFISELQKRYPELDYFKFHDLRATFGMNLVRKLSYKGYKSGYILTEVRSRMGHASIETTQIYLDFEQIAERYSSIALEFEEQLLSGYEDLA